jgi:protein-S-isoprenylcysteine O-methyltransferase Ste14
MHDTEDGKPGAADNAGVIAHPPVIYLAGLIVGCVLEFVLPLGQGAFTGAALQIAAGVAMAVAGAGLLLVAARRFISAGTNIPTNLPSTALVTHGVYAWSRNPIYLALTGIYAGLAIAGALWWALIILPAVLVIMRIGVIAREEAYLTGKFGDAYTDYCKRVRRWI